MFLFPPPMNISNYHSWDGQCNEKIFVIKGQAEVCDRSHHNGKWRHCLIEMHGDDAKPRWFLWSKRTLTPQCIDKTKKLWDISKLFIKVKCTCDLIKILKKQGMADQNTLCVFLRPWKYIFHCENTKLAAEDLRSSNKAFSKSCKWW